MATQKSYVVIGGGGFLGRWVVQELLDRGEKDVAVVDLRKTFEDSRVKFVEGNMTDINSMKNALKGAYCVIHTASPTAGAKTANQRDFYFHVNVKGTKNVIDACVENGVKQLVFTSSASVVFDGNDLNNVDESLPYCKKHFDAYNESKAQAEEAVLAANGRGGLATAAIRPASIFGPRDVQGWPGFIGAAKAGKSKYQIGDGSNRVDWTYVENVAYAHVLASDKLETASASVGGKAFFITNDEPIPFWDMPKFIYHELAYPPPSVKIPRSVCLFFAYIVEFFVWMLSPIVTFQPTFTKFRVILASASRTFNISRAKRDLGYAPKVNMQEAMKRTLKFFENERNPKASVLKKTE